MFYTIAHDIAMDNMVRATGKSHDTIMQLFETCTCQCYMLTQKQFKDKKDIYSNTLSYPFVLIDSAYQITVPADKHALATLSYYNHVCT